VSNKSKQPKMTIKEIRATIQNLNWVRIDATGGTSEENKRSQLPTRLGAHIAAVEALEIHPRFASDIENRQAALARASVAIARWHANAINGNPTKSNQ
jgi:hypothetical protein